MSYSPEKNKLYLKERYETQRKFLFSLLGDRCAKCQSQEKLEFDHINPKDKTLEIGRLFTKRTIQGGIQEIVTKCQILCKKCHEDKSAREFSLRPKTFRHGTIYAWMRIRCKCSECLKAKWAWHDARNNRLRKRAQPNKTRRD